MRQFSKELFVRWSAVNKGDLKKRVCLLENGADLAGGWKAMNEVKPGYKQTDVGVIPEGRANVLATSSDELVSLDHAILENNTPSIEF